MERVAKDNNQFMVSLYMSIDKQPGIQHIYSLLMCQYLTSQTCLGVYKNFG